MGVKLGNLDISAFKVGSGDCSIYLGDTKLYPTTHDYSQDYFTLVAIDNCTFSRANDYNYVYYSTDDGNTWSSHWSTFPSITAGNKIIFRGSLSPSSSKGIGVFSSTGRFNAEGNPMSLIYNNNFRTKDSLSGKNNAFRYLFSGATNLVSAENLSLNATTLSDNCYAYMFYGCTSLTAAPQLPATALTTYCYAQMFYSCTSLEKAPDLMAKTLAQGCYTYMFGFDSSLNYVKCLATDISASSCTNNWLYRVSSSGTFVKSTSMNSWTSGANGIPENWTVENYGSQDYQWVYYTAGDDIPSDDNICGIRVEILGATVSFEITFMDSDENTFVFGYDVDSDTWYGSDDSYTDVVEITPSGGYATYIFSDNGLPDNCTIDSITSDFGDYIPCDLELYQLTT